MTTHLQLMLRLRMRGAIPPLPIRHGVVFKHRIRFHGMVLIRTQGQMYFLSFTFSYGNYMRAVIAQSV
jgi:hypothetical protein